MKWFFDIEKFKTCLEDFKDYPWIQENILRVWSNYNGQPVVFPYFKCDRVGCFREEMHERERGHAVCVLKEWCKEA